MSLKLSTISKRAVRDARSDLAKGESVDQLDGTSSVAFYWYFDPDYERKKGLWARTYAAAYNHVVQKARSNTALNVQLGRWIKAEGVRFRRKAGEIVMDIKKKV